MQSPLSFRPSAEQGKLVGELKRVADRILLANSVRLPSSMSQSQELFSIMKNLTLEMGLDPILALETHTQNLCF